MYTTFISNTAGEDSETFQKCGGSAWGMEGSHILMWNAEERLHTLTSNLLELNIPYPLICNLVPYFWDLYIYFEGATPEWSKGWWENCASLPQVYTLCRNILKLHILHILHILYAHSPDMRVLKTGQGVVEYLRLAGTLSKDQILEIAKNVLLLSEKKISALFH